MQNRFVDNHSTYLILLNISPVLWGLVLLTFVSYLLILCIFIGLSMFGQKLCPESGLCDLILKPVWNL